MLRSDSPHAPRASPNTPRAAEHLYTSAVDMPDPAARELDGDVELETAEWLQALADVLRVEGPERAGELLKALLQQVRHDGVSVPGDLTTPYLNTIETAEEPPIPGERKIEHSLRSLVRWNAMAMVVQANQRVLGARRPHRQLRLVRPRSTTSASTTSGTRRTRATAATSSISRDTPSPGIYARAFLEGRLDRGAAATASARRSTGTGCRPIRTRG